MTDRNGEEKKPFLIDGFFTNGKRRNKARRTRLRFRKARQSEMTNRAVVAVTGRICTLLLAVAMMVDVDGFHHIGHDEYSQRQPCDDTPASYDLFHILHSFK
ncbi:MAG: hypothetical protein LBP64_06435 [Tannerella sp.]|nr:hypothetical protein [Tannerella sp.]